MTEALDIVNPLQEQGWDELLLRSEGISFFHSSSWARTLAESYRYQPRYVVSIRDNRLSVLVPFMDITSTLTGRRGVSLPFSDYCEPVLASDIPRGDVRSRILHLGEESGWKSIEVRGGQELFTDEPHSSFYFGHTLDLTGTAERVFSGFGSSTQRNIRKASNEGVHVRTEASREALKEFYRLNCLSRKEHGLPPQPYRFFQRVHKHILAIKKGIIMLAFHEGRAIAGAIFFHFGNTAMYKYGASDRKFLHVRANNLIIWEAIQWYCRSGYKSLCFGRTEPENHGLRRFKAGWGCTERIIRYFTYDVRGRVFVTLPSEGRTLPTAAFKALPVPVSKIVGKVLYRHVG